MEDILNLLQLIKERNLNGQYVSIALGKNKFPESISEGYQMLKQELWQKK